MMLAGQATLIWPVLQSIPVSKMSMDAATTQVGERLDSIVRNFAGGQTKTRHITLHFLLWRIYAGPNQWGDLDLGGLLT